RTGRIVLSLRSKVPKARVVSGVLETDSRRQSRPQRRVRSWCAMFDIAWGEFIVIAVVALIVIGPKELPAVLRTIGQWTVKIRRMAAEFQGQFQEALREAEMADLRKEVDGLNEQAKN